MKDYWKDLPMRCRMSKKERFNYIMAKINGEEPVEEEKGAGSGLHEQTIEETD